MKKREYEVTWVVTGSLKMTAISRDDAMTKVNSLSLGDLMAIRSHHGLEYSGPNATDCDDPETDDEGGEG